MGQTSNLLESTPTEIMSALAVDKGLNPLATSRAARTTDDGNYFTRWLTDYWTGWKSRIATSILSNVSNSTYSPMEKGQ